MQYTAHQKSIIKQMKARTARYCEKEDYFTDLQTDPEFTRRVITLEEILTTTYDY